MRDILEYLEYIKDRWESDSVFRDQITLAAAVGAVTLIFTMLDIRIRVRSGVYPYV